MAATSIAALRRRFQALGWDLHESPRLGSKRRASVLVPLTQDGSILLTQRPANMRSHGGEVCFPGGKQDPEDNGDDIKTALRETKEEIGRTDIEPLCRLPPVESYHGLCVTPIVGYVQNEIDVDQLKLSENEVETAFLVPLWFFADDANLAGPVEQIDWHGGKFDMRTYNYSCDGRTFTVWGMTAYIAHQAACVAMFCGKGSLYRFDASRSVWRKGYYTFSGDSILHEYESPEHIKQSANKKNRIHLNSSSVYIIDVQHAPNRYIFEVHSLEGRVIWKLAGESETTRQQWTGWLRERGSYT